MARPWFDHFRFVAPIYDHVFGSDSAPQQFTDLLALPADGWLLDAGGGTGRVSDALRSQVHGIVIADVSLGMLRRAAGKNGVAPTLGQVERLPFADGQFARILIVDAFHHFYHYEEAAVELWRVLAPGGRLVIVEPDIARWQVKLIALGEKLLLMRSHFFRAEELGLLFKAQKNARVAVDVESNPFHIQLIAEKTGQGTGGVSA
jgi:demethylmenaquinone methyltransferase/2-methoxy-6-polyprenyl-1,4-benzoquinol methylase